MCGFFNGKRHQSLHVWAFIHPPFVVAKSCSVDELFCCRLPIHSGHGLTQCFQHHSCAFLTGGALKCWGLNDFGQVLSFELLVLGFLDVFNVNLSGQVGDNSQTSRNTPTDVVGLDSGVIRTSHGAVRFVHYSVVWVLRLSWQVNCSTILAPF